MGYCGVLEGAIHAAHGKDTDLSATTMGEVSVRPYLCRGMDCRTVANVALLR